MTKNMLFLMAVVFYPITLIISNIASFKLNYIAALVIIISAFKDSISDKKTFLIIILCFIFLFLKFSIYGDFSVKEIIVLLFGPLVFNKFTNDFDRLDCSQRKTIVNLVKYTGVLFCLLVIFQFYNYIPMTLGSMDFLNIVGMSVFGDYDFSYRPSAYFYHPYDTSLAIIPFLAFAIVFFIQNKCVSSMAFLTISLIAVYCLQLKVLYGFSLCLFLFFFFLKSIQLRKIYFFSLGVFLTLLVFYFAVGEYSREEVSYSAGRLIIWKYNFEEYFDSITVGKIIFGLSANPLENNVLWSNDEFFTTHNLYLFLVVNTGLIFTPVFVYLKAMTINKSFLVDFCIIMLMMTFAFTGDLMIFTSYWICISCIYAVSHQFNLNMNQQKLKRPE